MVTPSEFAKFLEVVQSANQSKCKSFNYRSAVKYGVYYSRSRKPFELMARVIAYRVKWRLRETAQRPDAD